MSTTGTRTNSNKGMIGLTAKVATLSKDHGGLKLHRKPKQIKLVSEQGVPFGLRMILDDPRMASLQSLLAAERIAEDQG